MNQLEAHASRLKKDFKIDLRIRGILNSEIMLLEPNELPLREWKSRMETKSVPANVEAFLTHIQADHIPHCVLIDCTASEETAAQYPKWLSMGFHIITPNKKANTGSIELYHEIRTAAQLKGRRYLYEATVGAGLPVINTLQDLLHTGDRVLQIEGILSGTLSYLFNNFSKEKSFSDTVKEAKQKGFTEPDPRDDLSGTDVARKLIILARECGMSVNLSDVQIQSLVPNSLRKVDLAEYMSKLQEQDSEMLAKLEEANKNGEVLRYVGIIPETGSPRVELKSYPGTHPFARIAGSDNIVSFTTSRYREQPLIVQGPGAGPEVTAAGVFADLLRLATFLGANR